MTDTDVKIASIEQELNRLWEEQKEKNQVKACLFNLVIYAHDERRTDYLKEISRIIASRYPCRIIFIQGNPDSNKHYFHVEVSQEMVGEGDETIACDLINIFVSQSQLKRVPFMILPHLITDLPINLLWGQDPTREHHILPHIKRYANRIIFDSECTACLQDFAKQILSKTAQHRLDVVDMNWVLTNGWREIIAETFYTDERILDLNQSREITIKYHLANASLVLHSEIQAIYLQGWLSALMNWHFISKSTAEDSIFLDYDAKGNKVKIALIGVRNSVDLMPGTITSVDIETVTDHSYLLSRNSIDANVLVHISSAEQCELPFTLPLPSLRRGSAFLKEVLFKPKSEHYIRMLQHIQMIDWH